VAHRHLDGILFVLGTCYPHGDPTGQFLEVDPRCRGFSHAWVELPGALVFEATRQRFYDHDCWVKVYQPHHLLRYTPEEAYGAAKTRKLPGFGYARYLSQYRHVFVKDDVATWRPPG
jgi:hypothetical protein